MQSAMSDSTDKWEGCSSDDPRMSVGLADYACFVFVYVSHTKDLEYFMVVRRPQQRDVRGHVVCGDSDACTSLPSISVACWLVGCLTSQ